MKITSPPGNNCFENTLGLLGLRRVGFPNFLLMLLKKFSQNNHFCWWWIEVSVGGDWKSFSLKIPRSVIYLKQTVLLEGWQLCQWQMSQDKYHQHSLPLCLWFIRSAFVSYHAFKPMKSFLWVLVEIHFSVRAEQNNFRFHTTCARALCRKIRKQPVAELCQAKHSFS